MILSLVPALSVFRRRPFRLLWAGQLTSTIGSALTSLTASILVFRLTDSALSVGLMLMVTALPTVLLGLFAGILVDRFDRRRIMIAADLLRALLIFLVPVLIPFGLVWLYVLVFLSSVVGQFFEPAYESLLPDVISEREFAAANSITAISSFAATAIGFAISGLVASQLPIEWVFYLDAMSFLFSVLCLTAIRIPNFKKEKSDVATVVRNLRKGANFPFRSSILRSTFVVAGAISLIFGLWDSLLLPFTVRVLNGNSFDYGLQEALTSIGFVLGGLAMVILVDRLREGHWLVISFIGMGLLDLLYALSSSVSLAFVLITASGFMHAPYFIVRRLLIQRNTPRSMRGRVNSVFFVARDLMFLLGMLAAGLADLFEVRLILLFASSLTIILGLLVFLLPGLGRPAREWQRRLKALNAANEQTEAQTELTRAAVSQDLEILVGLLPVLAGLEEKERNNLLDNSKIVEFSPNSSILRHGEVGDSAYFVLDGQAAVGIKTKNGQYRALSALYPGDFFGEISALTGAPRTADVVAEDKTTLLQIPAQTLKSMMNDPNINNLFLAKLTERLDELLTELPLLNRFDQQALRDLRTIHSENAKFKTKDKNIS